MKFPSRALLTAILLTVSALPLTHAQSGPVGKRVFESNCAMCHTASPDLRSLMGPGLHGVVGRKIGGVPGFGYSAALAGLAAQGKAWTADELARYLADPARFAPGTTMPVNVADAAERAELVRYLAQLTGGKPPVVAPQPASRTNGATGAKAADEPGHWSADRPGRIHALKVSQLPKPYATESASNSPKTVPRPEGTLPSVPDGFGVQLWARDADRGRVMVKAPNGDIFISSTPKRLVKVFRSSTGDTADTISTFASGMDRPFGMAFWPVGPDPKYLYVAFVNSIVRYPYRNGDLVATGAPEVVVSRLSAAVGAHSSRTLAFSNDGRTLFLSIGSATNVAEGIGRTPPEPIAAWEARHGMGAAWGEEEGHALVLAFDPDGSNRRTFATGLRNCVGMYVHPRSGDLICSVNERDLLGDNLPPDYLTRVKPGAFYGWPWYYIGAHEDPRLAGHRPDLRNKVTTPDLLLMAHSAPLGMVMYEAPAHGPAAFPRAYDGDLFLAFHGSWNRHTRTGSKVVRVLMKNGVPTGRYQDFMTGFVISDQEVWGRPSSVAVQNDGSLLVDDDVTGEIWRVFPK
ncbi:MULTISPECIES: PQQ-dependent sugar dehydrogenase [unclassified Roseateles]|uniref:PQQ-dependent sugar dehydrogenase n=1 Tax=unclassified Roseateles TaxID=2626991 RepID=UPI0006FB390F|nr:MULTISPECIES: PQQ-dependent sugar dehydrogenase [unclassified Roseateles]KQW42252.1 sorbosone dehydrogenase [Pelomonas sp. Root405]KRA68125.1 sorbosone dehydrogenase [Pelomonas sp. Root662]